MVSIEEKAATFAAELRLIFDDDIREFTRLCVVNALPWRMNYVGVLGVSRVEI